VIACFLLCVFGYPLIAGFLNTAVVAFSNQSAISATANSSLTFNYFKDFFTYPGVGKSIVLALWVGLASTALAVFIASNICQVLLLANTTTKSSSRVSKLIMVFSQWMISFPHVAFAISLALLIAPSGSLLRWLSPWLTGFERPPNWITLHDPYGLALILGLALKESAFLVMSFLSASSQIPLHNYQQHGMTMGYRPAAIWWKILFQPIYQQSKLPIFIVLSYSLAVVEISLILGPNTPPSLPVLVWQLFTDAEPNHQLIASAGALILAAVVILSFASWLFIEKIIATCFKAWQFNGRRTTSLALGRTSAYIQCSIFYLIIALAILTLIIMAFSWRWRFQTPLPTQWQMSLIFKTIKQTQPLITQSIILGVSTAVISVCFVIAVLELLVASQSKLLSNSSVGLMYLPLLLPPLVFLVGVQFQFIQLGLDGSFTAVLLGHLLYAIPYVYLVLKGPWLAHDPWQTLHARLLTGSYIVAFLKIKLAQLKAPIAYGLALALAVSIAQYLTTLLLGAGRFATITTEAVTLSSGGDRRVVAIMALMQCSIPLLGFFIASRFYNTTATRKQAPQ
jgi:putative thiamine transport system permease protein